MNPYQHTHVAMQRIHERLILWVRDLMLQSGVESVQVFGRFRDEQSAGPHLVLMPYALAPWPKNVETEADLSLMGGGTGDGVVPDAWMRLGELLVECLGQCFPVIPGRGTQPDRMKPIAPLKDLPPPLRAWYKERGETEDVGSWVVTLDGVPCGRMPSLRWRRPLTLRASYLVMASEGSVKANSSAASSVSFAIPALSVVSLGIHLERTINVDLPPVGADPALLRMALLLAKSVKGEAGEELEAIADALGREWTTRVSILPLGDMTEGDLAGVMRSLDRPFQPVANLGVQVGLGGGPVFEPGMQPVFTTNQSER